MAAGIPQLIVPFMHDQFFNADRVSSLGLGAKMYGFQFKTTRVAKVLEHLLGSESVTRNCAAYAARFHGPAGAAQACDLVEQTFCA